MEKRMLCYLMGMEPYYIQCIKDGSFKPKTAKDDIMESVISCETAKSTWIDLIHSSKDPSNTKENRIMDLKLENANHTQTLDLADIYGRFFYEDNLISKRYTEKKKALITTPSNSPISTAFFSNNIVQNFQENSDDEANERSSEEYLRDIELEFHERDQLANSKCFIKRKIKFSSQKANEDTECYKCGKKVKELIALADDELSVGKNHARNGEWVDITMKKRHIREPIWYLDNGFFKECNWKCLHLLHMDLFGPVSLMSINHEKCTLVIIDEYSRTDNGTEFRNSNFESFCDEKGISQNFSSPYTLEKNGVAERKNRTIIEAARTMLNGSVLITTQNFHQMQNQPILL
ncbi:retrovirus-related pol polyprotein from transposon TNT 1-94 [Tanacetum coccineum]